jgi:hypothetical protein
LEFQVPKATNDAKVDKAIEKCEHGEASTDDIYAIYSDGGNEFSVSICLEHIHTHNAISRGGNVCSLD